MPVNTSSASNPARIPCASGLAANRFRSLGPIRTSSRLWNCLSSIIKASTRPLGLAICGWPCLSVCSFSLFASLPTCPGLISTVKAMLYLGSLACFFVGMYPEALSFCGWRYCWSCCGGSCCCNWRCSWYNWLRFWLPASPPTPRT